jgi:hypothetical protein
VRRRSRWRMDCPQAPKKSRDLASFLPFTATFVADPQQPPAKSVSIALQPYAAAIGSLMVPGGLGQNN